MSENNVFLKWSYEQIITDLKSQLEALEDPKYEKNISQLRKMLSVVKKYDMGHLLIENGINLTLADLENDEKNRDDLIINRRYELEHWEKQLYKIQDPTGYIADENRNAINELIQPLQEQIELLKRQIEAETSNEGKVKKIPEKSNISYQWQSNPDKELPELYNKMKGKFIDNATTLEQFKAIFSGEPVENIIPLKWIHSNRLLAYFLDQSFRGREWQSIAGNGKFFLNRKGKILTANDLSKAKKDYTDYGEPKGHEKIDQILKEIKNIKNLKTS